MTNQELLVFAAKAGGYDDAEYQDMTGWGEVRYGYSEAIHSQKLYDETGSGYWNSLVDGNDAMRLANRLDLKITPPKYKGYGTTVEPTRHSTAGCTCFRYDVDEQTRYAITHVAAEIGRAALAVSDLAKEGAR